MPKEIIYDATGPYVELPDGGELPADQAQPGSGLGVRQRSVHVGWTRKEFVEVGVNSICTATEERGQGVYATLDRQGINRLIQSLRKARDQAFGRDE